MSKLDQYRFGSFGVQAVCCVSLSMSAAAAVAQAPSASNSGETLALEEIVVTARKMSENAQDVPLSVNVFTADALIEKGVSNFAEVSGLAPNLIWNDSGGGTLRNVMTIRGISSGASEFGFDPGVGIYLDEVYVGNAIGFNAALLDIERIEVLKGPQGTLFGRNTTAGAISLHTRRPSTEEFYTDTSVRIGTFDLKEAHAVSNIPLAATAALKLSGIYRDRDGYQRNVVTGRRDLNNEHFYGGRAQLLWAPNAQFDLLASADYYKNDDKQDIYSCSGAPFCDTFNPTRESVYEDLAADNDTRSERTMWSVSLRGTWRPSDAYEIVSISAYRHLDAFIDQDQDYTPLDLVRSGSLLPKDYQFSQELRLATAQDRRARGVAGLYYFTSDRDVTIPLIFTGPAIASIGGANEDLVQLTNSTQETSSWAFFGQGSYDITTRLTGELGVRYSNDSKKFTYEQTESSVVATIPPPLVQALFLIPFPPSRGDDSWGETTGTASLTFNFTEEVLAYGRYSRGYKSGGFQAVTNSAGLDPTRPFGPELLDQYEIGVKSELLERRLRLNFAAFRMDYDDLQVQITDPITRQKFVTNLGSAESEGVEFEFSAAPLRGLTIDGNLGRQRAKFVSGPNAGSKLQYAPQTTGSLTLTFEHQLGASWLGTVSATGAYRDDMFLSTDNDFVSPSVTTVNARIGAEHEKGSWGIYLWGANLGDEQRFQDYTPTNVVTPEAFHVSVPRTYGVELRARF